MELLPKHVDLSAEFFEEEFSKLAAVNDVAELKRKATLLSEFLQFEALLFDLSAAFINVPANEVDAKIEQALQKLVGFLGFDRITVWHFSPDDGRAQVTHSYALPGILPPPQVLDEVVPVWVTLGRQGKMFYISDTDELPEDQWRERIYCREQGGIKSILFIPLSVGGAMLGATSFVSCHAKRAWPEVFVQRLCLLGGVLANAIERKMTDQKMQKAFAEIEQLRDRLEAENLYLRDQIDDEHQHEEIIGQSAAIRTVLLQVRQVAATDSTVLLLGETGTGKELLARAIHNYSKRKGRVMIKLNCAALPPNLIEAELFGYEKGAYTGALARQIGRFEAADGATIFLDEIGELPLELQAKLLRVLQEGQFERLGSPVPIAVDVRVIAATNRDLTEAVRQGKFRQDLYYRLNVFPIAIPPLRERQEDIPALVWAMVNEFGKLFGKSIERIPKKNMEALERYPWPGNIRELRNMVERAMILNSSPTLVVDLPAGSCAAPPIQATFVEAERRHLLAVLEMTGWRVRGENGAAAILGLKPTTLDAKMKKLSICRPGCRTPK